MVYSLSASDIELLKRTLASQAPDVISSHRAEAMARGLGFSTHAALLAALSAGPVQASADDTAFATFLAGRGGEELPGGVLTAALTAVKFPQDYAAMKAVMAREPDLSRNGMRTRHNDSTHAEDRESMLSADAIEEFQRAIEWLGTARQTSRITSKQSSYGYKHDVEHYHGARHPDRNNYVSNGMFIAAAIHMGFRIKRDDDDSPNVLLNLAAVEQKADQPRRRSNLAVSLRGPKNLRAWRNMMVAAINAGLAQKVFGLGPNDNWWPGKQAVYHFEFDGLPALASVNDAGFGELSFKVAINPTPQAEEWISASNAGLYAGDAFASGWLERKLGAWLQTSTAPTGSIRRFVLDRLADAQVLAQGFADNGKFMM